METNMIITGLEDVIKETNEIQHELIKIHDRVLKLIGMVGDAKPRIEIKKASDKAEAEGELVIPL